MRCPICGSMGFNSIDEFIDHLNKCRGEQRKAEGLIKKEKLMKERETRYREVQEAYSRSDKAKNDADKLKNKFIQDYPELAYTRELEARDINAFEKALSQLWGC